MGPALGTVAYLGFWTWLHPKFNLLISWQWLEFFIHRKNPEALSALLYHLSPLLLPLPLQVPLLLLSGGRGDNTREPLIFPQKDPSFLAHLVTLPLLSWCWSLLTTTTLSFGEAPASPGPSAHTPQPYPSLPQEGTSATALAGSADFKPLSGQTAAFLSLVSPAAADRSQEKAFLCSLGTERA